MNNYTPYHIHSDISNGFTGIDSVTKFEEYVQYASGLGIKSFGFSEHGWCGEWYKKKKAIEEAGMKYIHAVEIYVTEGLWEKKKDNYHCVLIARNLDGFYELNKLVSKAFNREDGHFYYHPRITMDELKSTSDNIIITTACIAGILSSSDEVLRSDFLQFAILNKERVFLEVQHHDVEVQKTYNAALANISKSTGLRLIAGTDSHSLNQDYARGRIVLQQAKKIFFSDEDIFDLTFKTYDELVESYAVQGVLSPEEYMTAIENTNVMADMIEPFAIDKSPKYPKLFEDSEGVFREKIEQAIQTHPAVKKYGENVVRKRVDEEFEVYKKTETIDFMLFQNFIREWERENGIYCGYSRGSVSGSFIAYLLHITEMDSMEFDLNFFRFMNPSRVSNCDIDTDYSNEDREKVKQFLFSLKNLKTSEIITFNTIATKGAIRDVARAQRFIIEERELAKENHEEIPNRPDICEPLTLEETDVISKSMDDPAAIRMYRLKYPRLFEWVDMLEGVIVSVGSHPAGVLISELDISATIGLCSLSGNDNPVSAVSMNPLDEMMYVKLDILGLDNVGVINGTCALAGIPRITPDNIDLEEEEVWKSIAEDTTCIFQMESTMAQQYIKRMFSPQTLEKVGDIRKIKLMSFLNGLIRPGCASIRDDAVDGATYDNGLKEINNFLSATFGYVVMQEDIMMFLVKFCGYNMAESDTVRRAIAKKKGTEKLLPEIERRFIEYTSTHYDVDAETCKEIIKPFLQIVLDSSAYGFSWNHSDAYSCIGYACGWLRYHYPKEFLTVCLNIWDGADQEKAVRIKEYAQKIGVKINPIKFGKSRSNYYLDKETGEIFQGISGVKFLNKEAGRILFNMGQEQFGTFVDLLIYIEEYTHINTRQVESLIKLNYFSNFGKNKKLLTIFEAFNEGAIKYTKTYVAATKIKRIAALKELESTLKDESLPLKEQLAFEIESLGVPITKSENARRMGYILSLNTKYSPVVRVYMIDTGKTFDFKVDKKRFGRNKFEVGDILALTGFQRKQKVRKVGDDWIPIPDEYDSWALDYTVIRG